MLITVRAHSLVLEPLPDRGIGPALASSFQVSCDLVAEARILFDFDNEVIPAVGIF